MISLTLTNSRLLAWRKAFEKRAVVVVGLLLAVISIFFFIHYYQNGLSVAYNDSRSHLDIGRRVVEGLKPGLAQLGSVWLPLTHLLMVPTIWNDFMWHSGLSGAIQSMGAFVFTGLLVYKFLEKLGVGLLGRLVGVAVFAANLNILYLQSTAMTELLLLATMTAGCYYLLLWHQKDDLLDLIKSAFWIMLSTLIRYDGWFLLAVSGLLIVFHAWRRRGYKTAEGTALLFGTLAGLGIVLWFLWNLLIFKDPLYFAFGPFSARAQQTQLEQAGVLVTKGDLLMSLKVYFHAMAFNSITVTALMGIAGAIALWFDKSRSLPTRVASLALWTPFVFNIIALYFGHSVLFIPSVSGSWFNVRYGLMLMPSIAIFVGFLTHRLAQLRGVFIGLLIFVTFFAFANKDAVTIDDAVVGSSGKNVAEVSGWLAENASDKSGFVLISVASHDAIIFTSRLPMKKFIHEGTGVYWDSAVAQPERWARWIIMRTYDNNDMTWRFVSKAPGFAHYTKVESYPFADIYEISPQFVDQLETREVFRGQK